jgi:hypothetical protein
MLSHLTERASHASATRFESRFGFFDVSLTLRSDSRAIIEFFDRLYRHFHVDRGAAEAWLTYDLLTEEGDSNAPVLRASDGRTFSLPNGPSVVRTAETILFHEVVSRVSSHFLVHGLAVSSWSEGLILAGHTGSGKTTLGLELARRGLTILSDELAALRRVSRLLDPFPRGLCVRERTFALVPGLDAPRRSSRPSVGPDRWMVDLEDLGNGPRWTACPPRYAIVLTTEEAPDPAQDDSPLLVALNRRDEVLLDRLSEIPGVRFRSIFEADGIFYARFRVRKDGAVHRAFIERCNAHHQSVLFRVKAVEASPDPARRPRLIPLARSAAALELFGHLQNLSFDGLESFSSPLGTPPQILAELSSMVVGMECYRLVVGDLAQTADLVCDLIKKGH